MKFFLICIFGLILIHKNRNQGQKILETHFENFYPPGFLWTATDGLALMKKIFVPGLVELGCTIAPRRGEEIGLLAKVVSP